MTTSNHPNWYIYQGNHEPHDKINTLPDPPPWRNFNRGKLNEEERGKVYIPNPQDIALVNAALFLRRPLLVVGKAGVGKTSLAYSVAYELKLGAVLRWSITTHTTLKEGLYHYDAIGRLQDSSLQKNSATPPHIGEYLRLGALGTAFSNPDPKKPRVLLIDEIDKSDIDLPNDLLHIFEEGEFEIPELVRLKGEYAIRPSDDGEPINIVEGRVRCQQFPLVIMTSNGEREFPPAFLRRCLPLEMQLPDEQKLAEIVKHHLSLGPEYHNKVNEFIQQFLDKRDKKKADLATDQLLNVIHLTLKNVDLLQPDKEQLLEALWKSLSAS